MFLYCQHQQHFIFIIDGSVKRDLLIQFINRRAKDFYVNLKLLMVAMCPNTSIKDKNNNNKKADSEVQ